MKCRFCGKEFEPDKQHPYKQYCSQKCCDRYNKGLFHLRPPSENKTLSEWTADVHVAATKWRQDRNIVGHAKGY